MRKTFLILFAICLSTWLMTDEVSAQSYNRVSEKNIKLVRGKKIVLKGAVRDWGEQYERKMSDLLATLDRPQFFRNKYL